MTCALQRLSRHLIAGLAFALATLAVACAGNGGPPSAPAASAAPTAQPSATPAPSASPSPTPNPNALVAPAGRWSFIPFPGSQCANGTATGIGVNPGTSQDLVIYFDGGGACWNALTCLTEQKAANINGYGAASFAADESGFGGSILDRTLANNPFAAASLVYVPYCTGDEHAGDNVATYVDASGISHAFHHVGHANALAYLTRILATWPAPSRLVITGSSAGGLGALFNFDTFAQAWAATPAYLIDDSGPPLENGAFGPPSPLAQIFANWNLGALLDPLCACRDGFAPALAALQTKYPSDRLSLLSYEQDNVVPGYYNISTAQFETDLLALASGVITTPNSKYFFLGGQGHVLLGNPAPLKQGVSLLTWLAEQVDDAPAWASQHP